MSLDKNDAELQPGKQKAGLHKPSQKVHYSRDSVAGEEDPGADLGRTEEVKSISTKPNPEFPKPPHSHHQHNR